MSFNWISIELPTLFCYPVLRPHTTCRPCDLHLWPSTSECLTHCGDLHSTLHQIWWKFVRPFVQKSWHLLCRSIMQSCDLDLRLYIKSTGALESAETLCLCQSQLISNNEFILHPLLQDVLGKLFHICRRGQLFAVSNISFFITRHSLV